jgi:hypothetical protein
MHSQKEIIFKLPQLNKPEDLLKFIAEDMDAGIREETKKEIERMSKETLCSLESITVGARKGLYLGRSMTFNTKNGKTL